MSLPMALAVSRRGDAVVFDVWAKPGAKHTRVMGARDGALVVSIAAAATEGRANEELIRFVAEELGLPRRAVGIVHGARSRKKRLSVHGVDPDRIGRLVGG